MKVIKLANILYYAYSDLIAKAKMAPQLMKEGAHIGCILVVLSASM